MASCDRSAASSSLSATRVSTSSSPRTPACPRICCTTTRTARPLSSAEPPRTTRGPWLPIRVEDDYFDGQIVIHNYGHGGAGVSLSWGCASTVGNLITGTGEEADRPDGGS